SYGKFASCLSLSVTLLANTFFPFIFWSPAATWRKFVLHFKPSIYQPSLFYFYSYVILSRSFREGRRKYSLPIRTSMQWAADVSTVLGDPDSHCPTSIFVFKILSSGSKDNYTYLLLLYPE